MRHFETAIVLALALVSCGRHLPDSPCGDGTDMAELSFIVRQEGTKSAYAYDEDTVSDWAVFIFDDAGRQLKHFDSMSAPDTMKLYVQKGTSCSFYALANCGGDIPGGKGYGSLASVGRQEMEQLTLPYGYEGKYIEMAWAERDRAVNNDAVIKIAFKRLIAKYIISISRTEQSLADIDIQSVTVKQAGTFLRPFADGSQGGFSDNSADGDRASSLDVDALNNGQSITLYVPQNTVTGTYLEIKAGYDRIDRISPSQLKYFTGKTATWRLLLGDEDAGNFEIEGNTAYHLTIQLTDEGVFRNCWKASLDNYDVTDCLLRWENATGEACAANTIESVTITNPLDSIAVFPKVVKGGILYADKEISVSSSYPYLKACCDGGYLVRGCEREKWDNIPLTASWTDESGNALQCDLIIKLRRTMVDMDSFENFGNKQNIIF